MARAALAAVACGHATGCILANGPVWTVEQAAYAPHPAPSELRASVAEVDLTPPPGLPSYGYSTNGVPAMRGYWLRIKARVLVVEQPARAADAADPPDDTSLVVLVQADFGAASPLIHRGVAAKLGEKGVSPANLLFATTHTHGGPGAIFGDKFFNKSVGARPLFVPRYVNWIIDELSAGIADALQRTAPARIGWGAALAREGSTFNRSYDAWERNALDAGDRPDPRASVDRTLRVLRVDTLGDDGAFHPAGAFSVFAVHGTAMPSSYALYHGDVHGLAARLAKRWIEKRPDARPGFVAAMATGAEGDVSPGRMGDPQGKALTMDAAEAEARAMVDAFERASATLSTTLRFDFAYHEASMRGAPTSRGKLCDEGALGAAEAAGSEVSQGPLNGFFEMEEGARRGFEGCQARKIKILGGLQDLFYSPDEYPDTVPFQIVRFAEPAIEVDPDKPDARPSLVLASFPGEPTTGVGQLVQRQIHAWMPAAEVATVGLTNAYATYFTTPSEFMVQDYEGGTTFYGPFQGVFAAEELGLLARSMSERRASREYLRTRSFQPGARDDTVWPSGACDANGWAAGEVEHGDVDGVAVIGFHWSGARADQLCVLPEVSIECLPKGSAPSAKPEPLHAGGYAVTDEGFDFEVFREGVGSWTASWTKKTSTPAGAECFFVVRRGGASAARQDLLLHSGPFTLEPPNAGAP